MPELVPVDHDPFSARLKPVDHDPWNISFRSAGRALNAAEDAAISGVTEFSQHPVESIYGVASGVAGDVKDFMDTGSPESSFKVATDLAGGGAAFAEKGAAGIFGGRLAHTFDRDAAIRATRMKEAGVSPHEINRKTGTTWGVDKQIRQEVDDSKAVMYTGDLTPAEATYRYGKSIPLDQILQHDEAFEAYPQLRNIVVQAENDPTRGGAWMGWNSNGNGLITLAGNATPEQFKNTLIHEMQHAVQSLEGFATGSSPKSFTPAKLVEAENNFENVKYNTESELLHEHGLGGQELEDTKTFIRGMEEGGPTSEQWDRIADKIRQLPYYEKLRNIVRSEDLLEKARDKATESYMRVMGEVEARNAERRMGMSAAERRQTHPFATQDRPSFSQKRSPYDIRSESPKLTPVDYDPFESK